MSFDRPPGEKFRGGSESAEDGSCEMIAEVRVQTDRERESADADGVADAVLVRAARSGDLDAFEILVRRHQDAVYGVAVRMLGSAADAQDASQEAFVQAWKALSRFRGESSFATWMYRIVTNRCLNAIAERRWDQPLPDRLAPLAGDPVDAVESRERLAALVDAIGLLPAEQRAAIVLREFQGLSYVESAEVLGVSSAAVKGRIHRGRLALVEMMAGWQ